MTAEKSVLALISAFENIKDMLASTFSVEFSWKLNEMLFSVKKHDQNNFSFIKLFSRELQHLLQKHGCLQEYSLALYYFVRKNESESLKKFLETQVEIFLFLQAHIKRLDIIYNYYFSNSRTYFGDSQTMWSKPNVSIAHEDYSDEDTDIDIDSLGYLYS